MKVFAASSLAERWRRLADSDLYFSFRRSPVTVGAAVVTGIIILSAVFAPLIAPHDPYDLTTLSLLDAFAPPVWFEDGTWDFMLGTDDQGRGMLSAIIYGARLSLWVGVVSVLFSGIFGVTMGLISGYVGGRTDAIIMRIAEVQLTFPAILIALLIDGVLRGILPVFMLEELAIYVVIVSIGISGWPQYARTVRASTIVETSKEYVQAATLTGIRPSMIMFRHVLPNVMGPVLVIATIHLAIAIINEATLSFLGVGIPVTQPSLGTLIRIGNNFLFSGEWWIAMFPGTALAILIVAVNLLGDWMRDAFNPKLR
jgi:peptide/nickel transport system permease protein